MRLLQVAGLLALAWLLALALGLPLGGLVHLLLVAALVLVLVWLMRERPTLP